MNDRYIIKCISLKNIETQRTSDDNIIAGKASQDIPLVLFPQALSMRL